MKLLYIYIYNESEKKKLHWKEKKYIKYFLFMGWINMSRELIKTMSPWEKVNIARHKDRPTGSFYIENIFTDFIELHGDRAYGDDAAIIGGIGFTSIVISAYILPAVAPPTTRFISYV